MTAIPSIDSQEVYVVNLLRVMAKLRSDGITHLARARATRWRALCGAGLMSEREPLPRVPGEVDCVGCLGFIHDVGAGNDNDVHDVEGDPWNERIAS